MPGTEARAEMDTHADTCCLGANFTPLVFTGQTVDVSPFSDHYEATKNVPVCSAATVVTTDNGIDYILIVHQALWFGNSLPNSLLNPNQMRMAGIKIRDDPTEEVFGLETEGLFIPFDTIGTTVYFNSRAPTTHEINESGYHIELTDDIDWDPSTIQLRTQVSTIATKDNVPQPKSQQGTEPDWILGSITGCHDDNDFATSIVAAVNVWECPKVSTSIGAIASEGRHTVITPVSLGLMWKVGIETAKKTLLVTTQQGVRQAVHPLRQRYRVDHLHLHRKTSALILLYGYIVFARNIA